MTSFYIASPFIATYQIKELNLPYTFIMLVNFGTSLLRMFLTLRMGKYGDRYGMAKVLKYAFAALGVQYLILAFTMQSNAYAMTIIGALCSAAAWSFIGIGMFGIQLEFLERDKRIIQLTFMSAISGVLCFFCFMGWSKNLNRITKDRDFNWNSFNLCITSAIFNRFYYDYSYSPLHEI